MNNNSEIIDLLYLILNEIDNHSLPYAIIHNADSLEEAVSGDIDIVMGENPLKRLYPLLIDFQKQYGYRLIQCLYYDIPHGYYFIIEKDGGYLHLDCLHDPHGISRYHLSSKYLMAGINKNNNIYKVNNEKEYVYSIIKRSLKGNITKDNLPPLLTNIPTDSTTLHQLEYWIGRINIDRLCSLKKDDIDQAKLLFTDCKHHIQATYKKIHYIRYVYGLSCSIYRKFIRYIKPTGVFVVIVGPDGCGKSTINTTCTAKLKRAFRFTWSFHWRPGLLPKLGKSSANNPTQDNSPSQKSKYKGITSYARFLYYWLDFVLGYWFVIYPKKAQTTFIIGERYYPDILAHPERYGFSCPQWWFRLFGTLVPKPDAIVLLSADPQLIYERKPELEQHIIKEQTEKYRDIIKDWGNYYEIDTSENIEKSVNEFTDIVYNTCNKRLQ